MGNQLRKRLMSFCLVKVVYFSELASYSAMISLLYKGEMVRPAKKLWDEMCVEGCKMNLTGTYYLLIRELSEEGEAEESLRLFKKMLEKEIEPDDTICTSLIEVYRNCMERDNTVVGRVLNACILNLCNKGQFGKASKLLREQEHLEHKSAHVVLLKCKCVADAKEIEIGIRHMK